MQIARPDSDISNPGGWTPSTPTALYDDIDDDVGSPDAEQIRRVVGYLDGDRMFEAGLSNVTDPGVSTGHTFKLRAQKTVVSEGGNPAVLRVDLVEGTTVRATQDFTLTTSPQNFSYTLTSGEANSISDYSNLRLRLTAVEPIGALDSYRYEVEAAQFEVPDAGYLHLDIDPPGLKVVPAASGHYLILDGPGYKRVAGVETVGSGALVLVDGQIKTS